jgi:hypothetical protein
MDSSSSLRFEDTNNKWKISNNNTQLNNKKIWTQDYKIEKHSNIKSNTIWIFKLEQEAFVTSTSVVKMSLRLNLLTMGI